LILFLWGKEKPEPNQTSEKYPTKICFKLQALSFKPQKNEKISRKKYIPLIVN
jgi:hypothetical protein